MAATKFTETEREKLFAQLEEPFDPAQIKWRVMRHSNDGRSGLVLPFADPRAYTDRLNQLFTPAGWTREYSISTVPSLTRVDKGRVVVTSKVLIATNVTINRLGSHTGTGEEWADRENAVMATDRRHLSVRVVASGSGAISIWHSAIQSRRRPIGISCTPYFPSLLMLSTERMRIMPSYSETFY